MADLPDLRALVIVADTGSFTAAAVECGITQPAMSARMASLERAIGGRVVDRTSRGIVLTDLGRELLPLAREIVARSEGLTAAADRFLGRSGGVLRLGASSVPGAYLLPRVLAAFRATHPDVRVRLAVTDTRETLEALALGEVELAVVGSSPNEPSVIAESVAEDEIIAVATPLLVAEIVGAKTVSPKRLRGVPLVLREEGSATRRIALDALRAAGLAVADLDIAFEIRGNAAVREVAIAGLGVAFLSRFVVADPIASGTLERLPLRMRAIKRPLWLVRSEERPLSPPAEAMAEAIRVTRA